MSKKTVVILGIAVAAGLVVVGVIVVKILGTLGGTPIIIKIIGDDGGDMTITGSPTPYQPTMGKDSHPRLDQIAGLYIRDASGKCVIYTFGKSALPQIFIDVKDAGGTIAEGEIDLHYSVPPPNTNTVIDLKFDEDTYTKSGADYKRNQHGTIQKVRVKPGIGTECTDKDNKPITPCPEEFSGSSPVKIVVNDSKVCQP